MNPDASHPAALPPEVLLGQCQTRRMRRRGPGGQHRNKVETAVVLQHQPTGVSAEAGERRSQAENLRVALFRLRVNLALEVRGEIGPTPSPLWQSRCRKGRLAISPSHDDFPAMLAEGLDAAAAHDADVKSAAEFLRCTPSQLTKLLKEQPRALGQVNATRKARGLGALR